MNAGISLEGLRDSIAQLQSIELKAMVLLREHRSPGQFTPRIGQNGITRESIIEAVGEIREYTDTCQSVANRLADLAPVSIKAFSVLEYGL